MDHTTLVLDADSCELHVKLDSKHNIYCENFRLAGRIKELLHTHFKRTATIGKKTTIPSKRNGDIAVFPIQVDTHNGNDLVIKTSDLILALGLEALLKTHKFHVLSVKLVAKNDNGRKANGERRSPHRR